MWWGALFFLMLSHLLIGVFFQCTSETIAVYKENFGDDYFAFYVGGCRFIALNSSLYAALEPDLWDFFEPAGRADREEV